MPPERDVEVELSHILRSEKGDPTASVFAIGAGQVALRGPDSLSPRFFISWSHFCHVCNIHVSFGFPTFGVSPRQAPLADAWCAGFVGRRWRDQCR